MERRVVIVDGAGGASHRWSEALLPIAPRGPEVVASLEDVPAHALTDRDVLLVDLPALGASELAALRERMPDTRALRLLSAEHHELPAVLQAGVDERFSAVVPRRGRGESVREVALVHLRGGVGAPEHEGDGELLRWTIARAVRVPGVVIRSLRPRDGCLELQLVLPAGRALDALRCELPRRWGGPVRDETRFGRVQRDQEIYVRCVRGSSDEVYLALLPWTGEARMTLAIGVWPPRAAIVGELFEQAVTEVPQLTLPRREEQRESVRHLLDYDWVISPEYAGPDRRDEDTSVLDAYMFVGRRRTLAKSIRDRVGGFVDAAPPWIAGYFVAYVVLALVDALCTWSFTGRGAVTELNPLLAPLIARSPCLFFFLKNGLALAAFAILVRFQLFRHAGLVLRTSVAAYALLDVYWAVLLLGALA